MPHDGLRDTLVDLVLDAGGESARHTALSFTFRDWGRLAVAGGLCLLAFAGVAGLAGVPVEPGFGGSLLAGGYPGVAIGVGLVVVVVGLVIGSAVAGRLGPGAAVFCAAVGLWGLAVRCGPIRPVLQYAGGHGVFPRLAVEVALLGGALVGGWVVLERLSLRARHRRGDGIPRFAVPHEVTDATLQQKGAAAGVMLLVMAAIELVLVQTDAAGQCLAAVAVAAFAATLAAYSYLPLNEGVWYWAAPTVLGVAAYLWAFASGSAGPTGELSGWSAALARPTPLHYASLGTASSILGHWCGRRWAQTDEPPALADPETPLP